MKSHLSPASSFELVKSGVKKNKSDAKVPANPSSKLQKIQDITAEPSKNELINIDIFRLDIHDFQLASKQLTLQTF